MINWESYGRKGIWRKNGGDDGGGALISLDGVASSRIVGTSAFIIFPLHHKTQKMACKNMIVGYHLVGSATCLHKQEVGRLSQNAAQLCAKANGCVHDDLSADKLWKARISIRYLEC